MSNSQLSICENRCFCKVVSAVEPRLKWNLFLGIISKSLMNAFHVSRIFNFHFITGTRCMWFAAKWDANRTNCEISETEIWPMANRAWCSSLHQDNHDRRQQPLAVVLITILDSDSISKYVCFCFPLYHTGQTLVPHDCWFLLRFCNCQCIWNCVL